MKTHIKTPFLLCALIAVLGLMPAGRLTAQTFTVLHTFTGTNPDGAYPKGGLILSGNTLYGPASNGGGSGGVGSVFAVNTDGTGFTKLHGLTYSDGSLPYGELILSGNTLYGTTSGEGNIGSSDSGTVFKMNINGTGFTNLHRFTATSASYPYVNGDGAHPHGGLILSGNTLYGTAYDGGSSARGTVFKVNTNGTGFTILHDFTPLPDGTVPNGLILSGNTLYGTTRFGGGPDNGTIFKINTDGTGYTNLHNFYGPGGPLGGIVPNELIVSGDTLYGTTVGGGDSDRGTVFKMNTNGTGFTILYSFTGIPYTPSSTNGAGAFPVAGLILSGNTLYGAAAGAASGFGLSDFGTVFAVNTDGTGFKTLYAFTFPDGNFINSDGAFPSARLLLSGSTLYGTATSAGSSSYGTVFSLSFSPQLTIARSGTNVLLTWPTNVAGFDYTGFTLQSTTNLVSPAVWNTNFPAPAIVNGQNTVTHPASGTQTFFQLKSQ